MIHQNTSFTPFPQKLTREALDNRFKAINYDITALTSSWNQFVEEKIKAGLLNYQNNFDAKNIFIDKDADTNSPFYSQSTNRPYTIYEIVEGLFSVLAYIDNGLKDVALIGNINSLIQLSDGDSHSISWQYSDAFFEVKLYNKDGNIITDITDTLDISVNISSNELLIENNTGGDVSFYGYAWHPVFK